MNANYWLDTATGKIRFTPDRKAVRRELQDHLEDRMEAGRAKGLSAYEAECAATAAMGDPDALAEALAKIHAPWWGRLWRLSQWALVIAVLVSVFSAVPRLWEDIQYDMRDPSFPLSVEEGSYTREFYPGYTKEVTVPEVWDISGSVDLGHYRFTVSGAWVEEWTASGEGIRESYAVRQLVITLRASTWRFWEPINAGQYMILSHEAVDSTGTRYGRWEPGLFSEETHRHYFCNTYSDGPLAVWYEIELDIPDGEMPDWVDIPIGYGAESLRVNFKEGVVEP